MESTEKSLSEKEIEAAETAAIQARADEIALKENCVVHPLVFQEKKGGEKIIGFIKEPPRIVKLRVLDKAPMGAMTAAAELLEAVLLKDYSDPRLYSERQEFDTIYLGACKVAFDLVQMSVNQFKKN